MKDPNKKTHAPVNPSDVCYRAFSLMREKQYDEAEKLLSANMAKTDDDAAVALYHSVLGVLSKLKGDFKAAWRHYDRAEKLLPDDPALKLISARLLIDEFSEVAIAIKKIKKVLDLMGHHPIFAHQAHTIMGLAFLKKSDKKKALESLLLSMRDDFTGLVTAQNIDLTLVEALLRKKTGEAECGAFLEKALVFAKQTNEEKFIGQFETMVQAFKTEYPPCS